MNMQIKILKENHPFYLVNWFCVAFICILEPYWLIFNDVQDSKSALHFASLLATIYYTTLYYTLYYTRLYTVVNCILLYYTILYCTLLYYVLL